MASACSEEAPSTLPVTAGSGPALTHDQAGLAKSTSSTPIRTWVDPLVIDRLKHAPRQRVLVELADPERDTPRLESPDDGFGARRRASVHRPTRARLDATKSALVRGLDAASASTVDVVHWYPPFSLIALDLSPPQVQLLTHLAGVERIHADREEQPALASSLPTIATPWFHQTRAAGQGTSVAVLDTPVRYDNGHFGSCSTPGAPGCAVAAWENFSTQSQQEVIGFEDANGKGSHGTNVAAIVHGVAPDARLLGLNVFYWSESEEGMRSRVSDQLDALAWVADNASTYGIVAVNMSIGGDPDGPGTCNDISRYDPIRTLWDEHGILTVVSSGNDGQPNATSPPGCISLAVTVGAHFDTELEDYDGSCEQLGPVEREIACFSNLSGMVDLLAPGVYIDAGGFTKSGTSMAAPHVAGAIAAWQSWFLQDEGGFKTPFWMHKRLLMQSSAPHVHTDGRRFQRLDFDQSAKWDYGRAFPYWFRETGDNVIPSDGSFFETSFDVSGQGWDVQSAYLVLDVVHEHPEHVEVRVESPDGKLALFRLPDGQAHFTGVVGRTVEPGALEALAGASVDGTWRLRIRDTVGTHTGNYLQGALYFNQQGCAPDCRGESCGDDGCGGSCGEICLISGTCHASGEVAPNNPCRSCIPQVSPSTWTAVEGIACDDNDACTLEDRCNAGSCRGDDLTCPPPGPCQESGACDSQTGECEYAARSDGLTCSDGDACTVADTCVDGACTGKAVDCSPPNACMRSSGCDAANGTCQFVPEANGTACPMGVCQAGSCVASTNQPSTDGGADSGGEMSNESSDDGGCGCRTRRGSAGSEAWLLLGALAGLIRSRRNRRAQR